MRTAFLHGEVELYAEAKRKLVRRFVGACGERGDGSEELIGHLLDDKLTRDGLLARWSEADVERFMVEVAPRRLVLRDWSSLPRVLHRWIDFLTGQGLLMPGDSPADVHAAIDRATPAYLAVMAEPAEWGATKFFSVARAEQGVASDDEEGVAEFFRAVESGAAGLDKALVDQAERREALEPRTPVYWLPPMPVPDDDTPAAEAPRTLLLRRMRVLLKWVGPGRELDAGRLAEPDVAELAVELATADAFAARVLVEWARHANLLRATSERLLRTQLSGPLLAEPGLLWTRLWETLVRLDEVFGVDAGALDLMAGGASAFPELVREALCALYSNTEAVPLELVVDLAVGSLLESAGREAGSASVSERAAVRRLLVRVLDQWEVMGAVRRFTTTDPERIAVIEGLVPGRLVAGGLAPDRTMVELMPLGVWGARRSLRSFGLVAPGVAEMVRCPAEVLALAVPSSPVDAAEEVITAWIAERGEQEASAELAALLRRVDDPAVRLATLWLLEHTGAAGVDAVLRLREDPVAGPAARMWLQARPIPEVVALRPGDELLFSLDTMSLTAEDDSALFLHEFRQQSTPEQIAVIDEIPRLRHSRAVMVLDAIAQLHPDERVSKAACRSLRKVRAGAAG